MVIPRLVGTETGLSLDKIGSTWAGVKKSLNPKVILSFLLVKRRKNMKITTLFLGVLLVLALVSKGFAQDFPAKPIRWINPFAPGGATGILSMAFQRSFEKELGTKILIEYIPGGSTKVGTMEVMKAKPDGYTILLFVGTGFIFQYYSGQYNEKIWEILTPLGNIAIESHGLITVRTDSPYKTWADLVKAAKENPGKLTCGGASAAGLPIYSINQITTAAGIKITYVPFQGAGPANVALLGGHIDFMVSAVGDSITSLRAGQTRGLAMANDKRLEALPDVPTFRQLGIDFVFPMGRAIWGPPKLPQNIQNIMSKAIERAVKDPEFVKLAENQLTSCAFW